MGRIIAVFILVGLLATACGSDDALEADAGSDFSVSVGESPTFDACESQGDIVNYAWKILSAPDGMPGDDGKMIAEESTDCSYQLTATMIEDEVGTWEVQLTIEDGDGATSTDAVMVEVTP
ncbi:MAG: PKD domain-containing protein [Actinomycetota bacterium]